MTLCPAPRRRTRGGHERLEDVVAARPTVGRVVAEAADEDVVARAAGEGVVAVTTDQDVVAFTSVEREEDGAGGRGRGVDDVVTLQRIHRQPVAGGDGTDDHRPRGKPRYGCVGARSGDGGDVVAVGPADHDVVGGEIVPARLGE